jgi:hypothetical protein
LRDPIDSMASDASYITNPYAGLPSQTPPPAGPPPPIPSGSRRTPTHPPGLPPINVAASQSAASFLLPPLNFVPLARDHFDTAQNLATSLLPPSHALRLTVALEYALFLSDCAREDSRARRLARRTIKELYRSAEDLSDEEFRDASELAQKLGGVVRRNTNEPTPRPSREDIVNATQRASRIPTIDRTIAVSPPQQQSNRRQSPSQMRSVMRTPERLSTVPEVESVEADGEVRTEPVTSEPVASTPMTSPPVSRLSSRSRQRRNSSSASDKASKRRLAEQAEEQHRRKNSTTSNRSNTSGGSGSRQATPPEGYVRKPRRRSSRNGNR